MLRSMKNCESCRILRFLSLADNIYWIQRNARLKIGRVCGLWRWENLKVPQGLQIILRKGEMYTVLLTCTSNLSPKSGIQKKKICCWGKKGLRILILDGTEYGLVNGWNMYRIYCTAASNSFHKERTHKRSKLQKLSQWNSNANDAHIPLILFSCNIISYY